MICLTWLWRISRSFVWNAEYVEKKERFTLVKFIWFSITSGRYIVFLSYIFYDIMASRGVIANIEILHKYKGRRNRHNFRHCCCSVAFVGYFPRKFQQNLITYFKWDYYLYSSYWICRWTHELYYSLPYIQPFIQFNAACWRLETVLKAFVTTVCCWPQMSRVFIDKIFCTWRSPCICGACHKQKYIEYYVGHRISKKHVTQAYIDRSIHQPTSVWDARFCIRCDVVNRLN